MILSFFNWELLSLLILYYISYELVELCIFVSYVLIFKLYLKCDLYFLFLSFFAFWIFNSIFKCDIETKLLYFEM